MTQPRETTDDLLRQAERQSTVLESIDSTLKWLFGLAVVTAIAWLIVVVNHV